VVNTVRFFFYLVRHRSCSNSPAPRRLPPLFPFSSFSRDENVCLLMRLYRILYPLIHLSCPLTLLLGDDHQDQPSYRAFLVLLLCSFLLCLAVRILISSPPSPPSPSLHSCYFLKTTGQRVPERRASRARSRIRRMCGLAILPCLSILLRRSSSGRLRRIQRRKGRRRRRNTDEDVDKQRMLACAQLAPLSASVSFSG
jgi:hypothetical protein